MTVERRKIVTLIVAIILAVPAAAIIFYNNDGSVEGITVTDMRDRTVTVPNDVDRIVCLSAGSLRFVEYLGAVDMVVGIDNDDGSVNARYYKATYRIAHDVTGIKNVGSEDNFNDIIGTNAQLIISSKTDKETLDSLQDKTGIPVIGINAEGSNTVGGDVFNRNIELLGKVLGKESRAKELIDGVASMVSEIEGMRDSSKTLADMTCYIGGMFYYKEGGLYRTSGNFEPFTLVGVTNVMPDKNNGNPYTTDNKELVKADPRYIFIDSMTADSTSKQTFDEERGILGGIAAVKDGNIYSLFVEKYYGTNWESELMNAYYIGNLLDPTTFDYDVKEKMGAVLKLFYIGSDMTLDDLVEKQGSGVGKLDW